MRCFRQSLSDNLITRIAETKELAADAGIVVTDAISGVKQTITPRSNAPSMRGNVTGKVVGIADGDTLSLLVGGQQLKIGLAEIDTPESGQAWGRKAKQALSKKVFRENVIIEVQDTDRYGRLVGKVWLGERHINRELVQEGHAWVYRGYLEDRSLLDDEQAAREAGSGLWSQPDPIAPWKYRRGDTN